MVQVSSAATHKSPDTMLDEAEWMVFNTELMTDHDPVVTINWQGRGGAIWNLMQFITTLDAIKSRGQKIVMNVTGVGASSQAIAVCYGDEIIMKANAQLMFHPLSCNARGEAYERCTPEQDDLGKMLLSQCVDKGIIPQHLADKSMQTDEVWVRKAPNGQFEYGVRHDPRQ